VSIERLRVLLRGQPVGVLERSDSQAQPAFTYDPHHVASSSFALSASLPLQRETYAPERVAPYLKGLLPENRDTLNAWADRLGTNADDVFAILARMGWDCPGAVQFCLEDALGDLRDRRSEYARVDDAYIAQRLRHLVSQPASWTMPEEHWSLGGQQEKFALALLDGSWHEAQGSAATTHIFKPGIPRLKNQALVEHVTMAAARIVGVDVAETKFTQFDDQAAIVVNRFDRFASPGSVERVHQEDFCQALRRLPEAKYEHRGGPTLKDMAGLIQRQSTDRLSDSRAVADFLAINVVAGAPDGHSKNISMLRDQAIWVAPLYDLATGLAYEKETVDRSVALSVGGEREVSRIRAKQWEKAAKTLKLDPDELIDRVRQLATEFPGAFATALSDCGDTPGASEVAARSGPAITEHCQRILAQI
jgi:serine/threonine-protein kinase HipA